MIQITGLRETCEEDGLQEEDRGHVGGGGWEEGGGGPDVQPVGWGWSDGPPRGGEGQGPFSVLC